MAKKYRKAKCVTLSISGKGNKIFRNTDSTPFGENEVENFDTLLEGGAIELVEDAPVEDAPKKGKKK